MKLKDIIKYALIGVACYGMYCVFLPYFDKYWIEKGVEKAATYATKYTLEDTQKFIKDTIVDDDKRFTADDFVIEKDEVGKTATVRLAYKDQITFFGKKLQDLAFTIEVKRSSVESHYFK